MAMIKANVEINGVTQTGLGDAPAGKGEKWAALAQGGDEVGGAGG